MNKELKMNDVLIKVLATEMSGKKIVGYVFKGEWDSKRKYVFVYQQDGERGIYVREYIQPIENERNEK